MPITCDNHSQPLYAYNQLLDAELAQVMTRPADESVHRYFRIGEAIYDVHEFCTHYDGWWWTNQDRRVAVQRVPDTTAVMVGTIK